MSPHQKPLFAALVLAIVAGSYLLGTSRGQTQALQRLDARIASIEARQQTLATGYLNGVARPQLAQQLGYTPHGANGAQARPGMADPRPRASAQNLQDKLVKMQQAFKAEAVNPAWANDTRQDIEDAIVSAGDEGNVAPRGIQTDCRSNSCMIDMDLSSSTEADAISETFLTDISDRLPITTMVMTPSADGSRIVLHILASKKPRS